MRLLLIRHAKAEDRAEDAQHDDAARALTPAGRRNMKLAAGALRRLHPKIVLLATSPLKRAVQTAKIIYTAYRDKPQFLELDLLGPGHTPQKLCAWIKHNDLDAATLALVGHEPDLSRLAAWFATGQEKTILSLKKGSVCVLDFPRAVGPAKGVITGVYTSKDLCTLA